MRKQLKVQQAGAHLLRLEVLSPIYSPQGILQTSPCSAAATSGGGAVSSAPRRRVSETTERP